MSLTQEALVLEKLKRLQPEQQQQILELVDAFVEQQEPTYHRVDLFGLWADLEIEISEEDIAEVHLLASHLQDACV